MTHINPVINYPVINTQNVHLVLLAKSAIPGTTVYPAGLQLQQKYIPWGFNLNPRHRRYDSSSDAVT